MSLPIRCALTIASAVLFGMNVSPASGETFDADYQITMASVPIGQMHVVGVLGETTHQLRVDGGVSVLGFASRLNASASGSAHKAVLRPEAYWAKSSGFLDRTTAVTFANGRAVRTVIEPSLDATEVLERYPIEPDQRVGVADPLSAAVLHLLEARQTGRPCEGIRHVYSGQLRFDMVLAIDKVTALETICRASVRPLGGQLRANDAKSPAAILLAFPNRKDDTFLLPRRIEMRLPLGIIVISRHL